MVCLGEACQIRIELVGLAAERLLIKLHKRLTWVGVALERTGTQLSVWDESLLVEVNLWDLLLGWLKKWHSTSVFLWTKASDIFDKVSFTVIYNTFFFKLYNNWTIYILIITLIIEFRFWFNKHVSLIEIFYIFKLLSSSLIKV